MRISVGLITLALAGSSLALPTAVKRQAPIQDAGNALKTASDTVGLTEAHNAVDAYLDGSLKAFENESGVTEATEGVGFQPFGIPITKRQAPIQDAGNALKVGSDTVGLTEAHNAVDAYLDGSLKAFENHSGVTEATEGVGFQPFGIPITKRQSGTVSGTVSITGSVSTAQSIADSLEASFKGLVSQLEGAFSDFTAATNGQGATATLTDVSSLATTFKSVTDVAASVEAELANLLKSLEAAFEALAAEAKLPDVGSLTNIASTLPDVSGGLPDVSGDLPAVSGGLPVVSGGLPVVANGLPALPTVGSGSGNVNAHTSSTSANVSS